jgi:hypothetical protein
VFKFSVHTTAIDLDIDEAGREDRVGGKCGYPGRQRVSEGDALDEAPETATSAGPRMTVPSNSCGAAIMKGARGGEWFIRIIAQLRRIPI